MKARGTCAPDAYSIEKLDTGDAEILLYQRIIPTENDEYEYDMYRITVPWRDALVADVAADTQGWLCHAKQLEITRLANEIRLTRDTLLAESDWTQVTDSPLSEEQKVLWRVYRQELRDVPKQAQFPYNVLWPIKPIEPNSAL